MHTRQRTKKFGVILVIVLLMIAISGAIAGQVASRTIRLKSQSVMSNHELQARWGMVSIRRAFLARAPIILANKSLETSVLVANRNSRFSMKLGEQKYEIELRDESAHASAPHLIERHGLQAVRPLLRELWRGNSMLRPVFPSAPSSWGQLFDIRSDGINGREYFNQLKVATEDLTLWSDGKLNLQTVEPSVLRAVWALEFGKPVPSALLQLVAQSNTTDIKMTLTQLDLTERERRFVDISLATQSNTYSVWISSEDAAHRAFNAVYVRRIDPGFADKHFGFHFP